MLAPLLHVSFTTTSNHLVRAIDLVHLSAQHAAGAPKCCPFRSMCQHNQASNHWVRALSTVHLFAQHVLLAGLLRSSQQPPGEPGAPVSLHSLLRQHWCRIEQPAATGEPGISVLLVLWCSTLMAGRSIQQRPTCMCSCSACCCCTSGKRLRPAQRVSVQRRAARLVRGLNRGAASQMAHAPTAPQPA